MVIGRRCYVRRSNPKNKKRASIMARIEINDLPKDMKISKDDMRKLTGGSISYSQISVGGGGGVPTESIGAGGCFLKIEGVPGESTDEGHADWIEVMSFSHGVSQTAGGDR